MTDLLILTAVSLSSAIVGAALMHLHRRHRTAYWRALYLNLDMRRWRAVNQLTPGANATVKRMVRILTGAE